MSINQVGIIPELDEDTSVKQDFLSQAGPEPLGKGDVKEFKIPVANTLQAEGIGDANRANGLMELVNDEYADGADMKAILKSEELEQKIEELKQEFSNFGRFVEHGQRVEQMDSKRIESLNVVMGLIKSDLNDVANSINQQDAYAESPLENDSLTCKVLKWISSSETVLGDAMGYLASKNGKQSSLTDFLQLQYAVQRATQRAELFASIVGTCVSSIKTIMTTQLG